MVKMIKSKDIDRSTTVTMECEDKGLDIDISIVNTKTNIALLHETMMTSIYGQCQCWNADFHKDKL